MPYATGHNTPGYLPEADVHYCETFEEAKSILIHDLKFAEDYAETEEAAENFAEAAEDVNLWSGPDSLVVDDRPDNEHSLGVAYWINEITDEEYEANASE